ncbi:IclR family transcriptional regulator [Xenorhabdus littoralis]|uniref:IclR family transcriptional regulator n=1 Tax=Xenorhabdus littoralis TaxID=2582835 RepID=UPI0029E7E51A|nr:IclR family transcriptional regulator [Xenorhabdus sp. psl]MDX7993254.1 IclR family transcriptional regulator [Xenorhabdus sp. psl]
MSDHRDRSSAVTRVLAIIEHIATSDAPLSSSEIASNLAIPIPTVHRQLAQLKHDGYLQQSLNGLWEPGNRLFRISQGVWSSARFKSGRTMILKTLAHKVNETCGISVPNGLEMLYYERVQANWPLQINLPEGSQTPLWCTASGKLYLANLPIAKRKKLLQDLPIHKMARNTITDLFDLNHELNTIAKTQISTDNEEFIDGMVACSVPVKDHKNRLIACVYVHAPAIRVSLETLLAFAEPMHQAAQALSRLGIADSVEL